MVGEALANIEEFRNRANRSVKTSVGDDGRQRTAGWQRGGVGEGKEGERFMSVKDIPVCC